MDSIKSDDRNIGIYANSVWNDSLTGSTKLIDESLRTKAGKYDDLDLFPRTMRDNWRKEDSSKPADDIRRHYTDSSYDYSYITDGTYIPQHSTSYDRAHNNRQNSGTKRTLLKKKKKHESYRKFMERMAVAIVICASVSGYVIGHNLFSNSQYLDKFSSSNSQISNSTVDDNINYDAIAQQRLNAISLQYSNIVKQDNKILYNNVNGSKFGFDSYGDPIIAYNESGITDLLKEANDKGELNLRLAVWTLSNKIEQRYLYRVLAPCLEKLGYDFIIPKEETGRKTIGPGYVNTNEYLKYELDNIYYDMLADTEEQVKNGTIFVYKDGSFYEKSVEDEKYDIYKQPYYQIDNHGRSK